MTLTESLEHPNSRLIFLADIVAGEYIYFWTQDATAWYAATNNIVIGATEDGAALSEASDLADCKATDGSYWHDTANARLYVNPTASNPNDATIMAQVVFYVSGGAGKTLLLNGNLYLDRIENPPTLSIRVPEQFGDLGQMGGGSFALANHDGYFNSLSGFAWDSGYIIMRLGVDLPHMGEEMVWGDYEIIGKWRPESWEIKETATFFLKEYKSRLKVNLPQNVFQQGALSVADFSWPNLHGDAVGEPVPLIMGTVAGVKAFCIDTTTNTFRVAGNAITSFTAFADADGVSFDATTTTPADAEFTYDSWDGSTTLYADVVAPYDNGADQIEQILTTHAGELSSALLTPGSGSAEEGTGFGTYGSRTNWVIGTDVNGDEYSSFAMGLYIPRVTDALSICNQIAETIGALFYIDIQGRYTLKYWEPVPSEGILHLKEGNDIDEIILENDAGDPVTSAVIKFSKNYRSNNSQVAISTDSGWQYRRGLPADRLETKETFLIRRVDALALGSRLVAMKGPPRSIYRIAANKRALLLEPGDPLKITYTRRGIDGYYDVVGKDTVGGHGKCTLYVTNWRGLDDRPGYLTADPPSFPSRLGGASAETYSSGWTDAQVQWAHENLIFISDDYCFEDSTDIRSHNESVVAP